MSTEYFLLTILPYTLLAFAWVMFIDYILVLPFTMRRTKAEVTGHASQLNNQGDTLYAARFRYSINGINYESVNDMWHRSPRPDIGTSVKIEYIRGNEQHAHFVNHFRKFYVLAFLGIALFAIYAVTNKFGISNTGIIIFSVLSMLLIVGVLNRHKKNLFK